MDLEYSMSHGESAGVHANQQRLVVVHVTELQYTQKRTFTSDDVASLV